MTQHPTLIRLLKELRQGLAPTPLTLRQRRVQTWFWLTLAFAVLFATLVVARGFSEPYVIPDDARQHVFWMQRFVDRTLFPEDPIADYYASVSPTGVVLLYKTAATLGIPPLLFNKLLPGGLILLTAMVAFLTCFELSALPAAAFAASLLLEQSVDFTSAVASGTAKAFAYPLTLLFMYGWLRRSYGLSWGAILLQGLFYPQAVLISSGLLVLGLVERQPGGLWRLQTDRRLWILTLGGLAIAAGVILQYALSSSDFGPTISLAEARTMPEFYEGGRTKFFRTHPLDFLLYGRSGIRLDTAFTPLTNLLALALPVMLYFPQAFPLTRALRPGLGILPRLLVTALFWYVAAHALLFKLYLPSRYTSHYLLIGFVLAASIALVLLIDALLYWTLQKSDRLPSLRRHPLAWIPPALTSGAALVLSLVLLLYPLTMSGFPTTSLSEGRQPDLYEFFATQPKDSLIASLTSETSNLPSFSQRSILVSSEVAIPYHVGYYRIIQTRARDLITAQYSPDPAVVKAFIERYGITHWLLQSNSFKLSTLKDDRWVQQYQPEGGNAVTVLAMGQKPVLARLGDRCTQFESGKYQVIDAQCLLAELDRFNG